MFLQTEIIGFALMKKKNAILILCEKFCEFFGKKLHKFWKFLKKK